MLYFIEFRCWVLTKCQTCCKFCSSLKVHLIYPITSWCSHYFHSDKSESQGTEMPSNLLGSHRARIWVQLDLETPNPVLHALPTEHTTPHSLVQSHLTLDLTIKGDHTMRSFAEAVFCLRKFALLPQGLEAVLKCICSITFLSPPYSVFMLWSSSMYQNLLNLWPLVARQLPSRNKFS